MSLDPQEKALLSRNTIDLDAFNLDVMDNVEDQSQDHLLVVIHNIARTEVDQLQLANLLEIVERNLQVLHLLDLHATNTIVVPIRAVHRQRWKEGHTW